MRHKYPTTGLAYAHNFLRCVDHLVDVGFRIFVAVQLFLNDLTRRFRHPQPCSRLGRSGVKNQSRQPGTEVLRERGDNTIEQGIVGLGVLSLVTARQIEQAPVVGKISRQMDRPAGQGKVHPYHLGYGTSAAASIR